MDKVSGSCARAWVLWVCGWIFLVWNWIFGLLLGFWPILGWLVCAGAVYMYVCVYVCERVRSCVRMRVAQA